MKKYLLIFAFICLVPSVSHAWFFGQDSPDCNDPSKICFSFFNSGAFAYTRVGWFGLATSTHVFNDATSSPLLGHHVLVYGSAWPRPVSVNSYVVGCSSDCDDPFVYREIPLRTVYDRGHTRLYFVADKTGACWTNRLSWDLDECVSSGGIEVANFNISNGGTFLASVNASSSDLLYLDLNDSNSDFILSFVGLTENVFYPIVFLSCGLGVIMFVNYLRK